MGDVELQQAWATIRDLASAREDPVANTDLPYNGDTYRTLRDFARVIEAIGGVRVPVPRRTRMTYPIKLNDNYTCQGIDAQGNSVVFSDLLDEGDKVGPPEDPEAFRRDPTGEGAAFADGIVVRKRDGLWIEAL